MTARKALADVAQSAGGRTARRRRARRHFSPGCTARAPRSRCRRIRRSASPSASAGSAISLIDIARLYAGLARGGEAPPLIERLDGPPPVIGAAPRHRSGRGLLCRGHPARRAAARQRAQRPHRLQDRHVLRLSRRAGDRLRPADDDRRLGRAARQRPDAGPDRPRGGRADSVRRLRAAGPRASSRSAPPKGVLARRPSPPNCRRRCAICARTRPRRSRRRKRRR